MVAVMEFREQSQRDVVFTPFMLRVRAAVQGELTEGAVLRLEPSPTAPIAMAHDEWFYLRARAEHVVAEANGMLAEDAERIQLDDEYGTGQLSFTMHWRNRRVKLGLALEGLHKGHITTEESGWDGHEAFGLDTKPTDQAYLEDLMVAMLGIQPSEVTVDAGTEEER